MRIYLLSVTFFFVTLRSNIYFMIVNLLTNFNIINNPFFSVTKGVPNTKRIKRTSAIVGCLPDRAIWCLKNVECCSGYCDRTNKNLHFGICKTKLVLKPPRIAGCLPVWANTCLRSDDCCSGFCDTNNGVWAFGVCKPKIKKQTKVVTSNCIPNWLNTCLKSSDCCSGKCDKSVGILNYGVCKP